MAKIKSYTLELTESDLVTLREACAALLVLDMRRRESARLRCHIDLVGPFDDLTCWRVAQLVALRDKLGGV